MGLSVRIGDESRTILRELAAGLLLNSLQARVPGCSRRVTLFLLQTAFSLFSRLELFLFLDLNEWFGHEAAIHR